MTNNNLDKITNILNDFLKPFDCVAEPGTDFAYYPATSTIYFAFVVNDKFAESFLTFAKSLHNVKADIFLWSFMHELGHHETEDEFDDEEEEMYRFRLSQKMTDEEYYNLPQEYAATDWAGAYMRTHEEEVSKLWETLTPAIKDFYKEMEIEI